MSSDIEPFESWSVSRSLVLMGQLHQWRDDGGESYSFASALIRNYRDIPEGRWLDELCDLPGGLSVTPFPQHSMPSQEAFSPQGTSLRSHCLAVPIASGPPLTFAALNPFGLDSLNSLLAEAFPGEETRIILTSPHSFNILLAACDRPGARESSCPDSPAQAWQQMLGPSFPATWRDIFGELSREGSIVFPDHFFGSNSSTLSDGRARAFYRSDRRVWYVCPTPNDRFLSERIQQDTGLTPIPAGVSPDEMQRMESAAADSSSSIAVSSDTPLHVPEWPVGLNDDDALYHSILSTAIDMGSSDIHIDPKADKVRVRFRIDGQLYEQAPLPKPTHQALLRIYKIHGNMRQNTTGELQDGAGYFIHKDKRYDLRYAIAILESADGVEESVNIRIFNSRVLGLGDLRMPLNDLRSVNWFLEQNGGMCILSGPTGSGKTTTLYALLNALDTPGKALVTVEQPVEKHYDNAKQISVEASGSLTYTTVLRSLLRQDPDVILVGEIRDEESARIAIQAALTGHQVLTTLHANDAPSIIQRMEFSFGIDRATQAVALRLLAAQRLVKRLCPYCRKLHTPRAEEVELFPDVRVASPVIGESSGCPACRFTGTLGRVLVIESLPVDTAAAAMIAHSRPLEEIAAYNARGGHPSLIRQATSLYFTGEIPASEARLFIDRADL